VDRSHLIAVTLGLAGGVLAGLFGIGGGLLFVPALTIGLGLGQLDAEATSLAAMLPVVIVGAWRQSRAGLVAGRPAIAIGLSSVGGVLAGAAIAESVPEHLLARGFGVLLLVLAVRLLRLGLRERRAPPAASPPAAS